MAYGINLKLTDDWKTNLETYIQNSTFKRNF